MWKSIGAWVEDEGVKVEEDGYRCGRGYNAWVERWGALMKGEVWRA